MRRRHRKSIAGILIPALLLLGGSAALAAALVPWPEAHTTAAGEAAILEELKARPEQAALQPAQPAPETATLPAPAAAPFVREIARSVAPVAAQSVSGVRSISGGARAPSGSQSGSSESGPWSLTLSAPNAPPGLVEAVTRALTERGIQVRPPGSPVGSDALVALTLGATAGAWFCDSAASNSQALAQSLASALAPAAPGPPPEGFGCGNLQGAGARTPASLAQLSSAQNLDTQAAGLAASVSGYFSRYGASQRRARDTARLSWPATGEITSAFGLAHPLGVDIGQWAGPARAASDGVVYYAGGNTCCSYGRFVVIDNPDGIRTLYAHLDSLAVKTGDRVKAGQVIGEVGCTGTCLGAHLHFEVFDRGLRQDPLAYLP